MLNSLSTLLQYLWHHRRQLNYLIRSKHSHSDDPNKSKHDSLPKSSLVNVVFTFNISARCFAPALPIALSNQTTNGVKCLLNRHNQHAKSRQKKAIYLHPRRSQVNIVFTFNDSAIWAAPSTPMTLSVYWTKIKQIWLKNLKRVRKTIHSLQKLIWFNVLFTSNALAISETPASPISLPNNENKLPIFRKNPTNKRKKTKQNKKKPHGKVKLLSMLYSLSTRRQYTLRHHRQVHYLNHIIEL